MFSEYCANHRLQRLTVKNASAKLREAIPLAKGTRNILNLVKDPQMCHESGYVMVV